MSSKTYFDKVAAQWDSIRASYFDDTLREKAYAVAGLRPGQTAADIGAGSGYITEGLIQRGLNVIAIDQSEAMLAEMRKKFAAASGISYRRGEAECLPVADASVDYVFANMYLHHVEQPLTAIREMVRLLKPGGKLIITDMDEHQFEFLRNELHDCWLGFSRSDIATWLTQAGLEQVVVESVDGGCCAQSECGCQSASISVFVASGVRPGRAAPGIERTLDPTVASNATDSQGTRASVREFYAAQARAATATVPGSCCQPTASACCSDMASSGSCCGSPAEVVDEVAPMATPPSWGCGNPTALVALRPGQVVLDLGSGAGYDVFQAAHLVAPPGGRQGRVIGVDMTDDMLDLARKHAERLGLTAVTEFRKGYIEDLPVADSSVDVVLSNCVINLSPDKAAVFREAYRVLKPGGWLAVSDIVTEGAMPEHLRQDTEAWASCIGGALQEEVYLDLVRQAGFEAITIDSRRVVAMLPEVRILSLSFRAFKPLNGTAS